MATEWNLVRSFTSTVCRRHTRSGTGSSADDGSMTPRRFFTLDVFTRSPFAGNPLAVVLDCDGLDAAAMLRIAGEFNLSETVFVLPPADPVNTAALRIFTPGGELPFAGHPTVGTAILLASLQAPQSLRAAGGIRIALEEQIGLVHVDVAEHDRLGIRGVFAIPRASVRLAGELDPARVAAALGISRDEIGLAGHELSVWSAGVPFAMVPVADLEAIGRAGFSDRGLWLEAFVAVERQSVFVYTTATVDPAHHVHARMFSPGMGIQEDPATGGAVAAFAGVATAFGHPADGTHQLIVEQGYEMGRPSEIALDLDINGGECIEARIGGSAVIVSEGKLFA